MSGAHLINATVGAFIVREFIAAGGAAEVFRAVHRSRNKVVAVKVLRRERATDRGHIKALQQEFVLLSRLHHPGVPKVLEFTQLNGRAALIMEFVDGASLASLVKQQADVNRAKALVDLVAAVVYLHTQRVVHNDLKLENAVLRPDGQLTLIDFGNAVVPSALSAISGIFRARPARIFGTPTYIAPEVLAGRTPSMASDCYALGVCTFILLTGAPPHGASSDSERLRAKGEDAPPIRTYLPELPLAAARAIDHCLVRHADQRLSEAEVLWRALDGVGGVRIRQSERIAVR